MVRKSITAFALAAISLPVMVQAEENGLYVSGGTGYSLLQDVEFKSASTNQKADTDAGLGLAGVLGYRYGNGFRSELELSYHDNDVDTISGANGQGDISSTALSANVIYDFNSFNGFTPYVGAGLGLARLEADSVSTIASSTVDDSDTAPILQGIVGASYNVAPAVDVFTQYHYTGAVGDVNFHTNSGTKLESDYRTNTVMVGVRYALGEVPSLRPVAAAPEQRSRTYMIFFDFDDAKVNDEAADVLQSAALQAKKGDLVRVELTGHADRSGTDTYNMTLSQKRAEAAKAYLIQQGIAAEAITTRAEGEKRPLVPTEDGVREPQNRRVEIVYSGR